MQYFFQCLLYGGFETTVNIDLKALSKLFPHINDFIDQRSSLSNGTCQDECQILKISLALPNLDIQTTLTDVS